MSKLTKKVRKLNLKPIRNRVIAQHRWDTDRVDAAIKEYRVFLQVHLEDPKTRRSPSSKDMDEIWHAHILFTKKYAKDCDKLFGHFMHHTPKKSSKKKRPACFPSAVHSCDCCDDNGCD